MKKTTTIKKLVIVSIVLTAGLTAMSEEGEPEQTQKIVREKIEWCDIWIPSAPETDLPRVLLVGDSITKGYYESVCKDLEGIAYCSKFATSACVSDPAFGEQLKAMFSQYKYDIVHFNNGLHGTGYTEEEYQAGYKKALLYIKNESPSSKIILALSTSLNSESDKNYLNSRINERNRIVRELGKKYNAEINDLYSISKDHPEYYKDPHHFKPEAIELQSRQVSDIIRKLLDGE
ncbi:MAG: SGNH/GDSL hydrolase family protein [Kiritimatiellales bacterium]